MFAKRALLALALLCAAGCQSIVDPESRGIPEIVAVQDGSPERTALNARVYDTAIRRVTRRFYDRQFNGVDFPAEAAARRAEAIAKPDEASFYLALNATLALLDDRHTVAISPTSFRNRRVNLQEGAPDFGMRVFDGTSAETDERVFIVHRVRPDSPAAEAGVLPGWRIESFNGEPWDVGREAPAGQPDLFHFKDRDGELQVRSIQYRRMPREVGSAERRPDGVLVLRFFRFDQETAAWLEARLAEARADPPRGVIVDIRMNNGGTIAASTRIIGGFFPRNVLFARYNFGVLQRVPRYTRTSRNAWTGPVAVVISNDSASAAEVFAAAIRDHRRGVVAGQTSAGVVVGSVGTKLPDGGVLDIGFTEFLTASGEVLEKVGVTPDLEIIPTFSDIVAGRDPMIDDTARALLDAPPSA